MFRRMGLIKRLNNKKFTTSVDKSTNSQVVTPEVTSGSSAVLSDEECRLRVIFNQLKSLMEGYSIDEHARDMEEFNALKCLFESVEKDFSSESLSVLQNTMLQFSFKVQEKNYSSQHVQCIQNDADALVSMSGLFRGNRQNKFEQSFPEIVYPDDLLQALELIMEQKNRLYGEISSWFVFDKPLKQAKANKLSILIGSMEHAYVHDQSWVEVVRAARSDVELTHGTFSHRVRDLLDEILNKQDKLAVETNRAMQV